MKKRILFTVFVLSMLLLIAAAPVYAAPEVTVILDGKVMSFDVPPQIVKDRTLVPLRAIFEGMGASIEWNGATETVTATKGSTVVVLTIGSTSPTINGNVVTIDQPGIIVNDRTLAPLRFVAEAFGGTVAWDDNSQTATISMGGASVAPTPSPEPSEEQEPTPMPEPTPTQPGGTIDQQLVGKWGGAFSGTSHYYDFKADGTFLYRIHRRDGNAFLPGSVLVAPSDSSYYSNTTSNYYFKGKWYLSDGVVYMTQRQITTFVDHGGDKPPENLDWQFVDDATMRIRFDEYDEATFQYTGSRRYIENLELESVGDGSLPVSYCILRYDNVPNWVFP